MTESHDPMCQVPLSYLLRLQARGDVVESKTVVYQGLTQEQGADQSDDIASLTARLETALAERDTFANAIAEFEFRAGCKLEHIPVEALGRAQDVYVSQQAIDTLKSENTRLEKDYNRAVSEMTDWRGRFKELQREKGGGMVEQIEAKTAPYGLTKAGVPRKKPGPPKRRKRAA